MIQNGNDEVDVDYDDVYISNMYLYVNPNFVSITRTADFNYIKPSFRGNYRLQDLLFPFLRWNCFVCQISNFIKKDYAMENTQTITIASVTVQKFVNITP